MGKLPTSSRFDHVSDTYDKYRIQYSLGVVEKICGHIKSPSKKVVVDVGYGTGIHTCQNKKVQRGYHQLHRQFSHISREANH
jgi:hypothetical protein